MLGVNYRTRTGTYIPSKVRRYLRTAKAPAPEYSTGRLAADDWPVRLAKLRPRVLYSGAGALVPSYLRYLLVTVVNSQQSPKPEWRMFRDARKHELCLKLPSPGSSSRCRLLVDGCRLCVGQLN